ncbi:MAG: Heat-inducible transcription repressor HrcA [bacterium ADurb.Bin431]|nr:MAG: Heat-inducible transcription repressor HrcA [bacterium ADurb.Bin431]HNY90586.1 heat-inducible transcriptional repressor HrcA [bacterium]HOC24125.1 heat-inducible transcriptional repressor HrcA [bacterium]HOH06025.1 heat-inducible transcriptional repressor HrcA [bacterium]HOY44702.1 heat-inducible transcriptional repressor HrcA [bacterium]
MTLDDLTERERQVFLSIVQSFIDTAEPVGSRYLSKFAELNLSPATIRNVMADLEEKGLIRQPHASAGRVPTDGGYRAYVDGMIGGVKLSPSERRSIVEQLNRFAEDVDLIIDQASHVLSNISSQLGVVLAPRFNQGRLEKIELVSVSEEKILVILTIASGLVKTIIVEMDEKVPGHLLEAARQILNERLHGLTIQEFQSTFEERFSDLDENSKRVLGKIRSRAEKLVGYDPVASFHVAGAGKIILQPEFASQEKVGVILNLIDRRDLLLRVLEESDCSGVSIVIGDENKQEVMKHCSIITTTYSIGGATGTIGVIGPTRMQYAKIIGLVQFMAETLGYVLNKQN